MFSPYLASLRIVVERVEDFVLIFEDLIEKQEHQMHETSKEKEYSQYLEKKTQELNVVKSKRVLSREFYLILPNYGIYHIYFIVEKLEDQYAQKVFQKEKEIQVTLRERQELFDMAFQQDMQLYKESGIIPNIRSKFL